MATYSSVCDLIHSLSKAEKRILHRNLGLSPGQMYVWIYRHIEKYPDDYSRLKNDFEGRFPGSSLSTAMNHLFDFVLSMLSSMEKRSSPNSQIVTLVQQISVLYARGFYDLCFQLNTKAVELCRKFELYDWMLYLLRMQLMLKTTTRFYQLEEAELFSLHNEIRQTLNYLQTQSQHQLQYDLLHTRRASVKSQSAQSLDDLAMHEGQIFSNPRYKSFTAEKLHLMFQVEYFLAKGNTETSLRIARSLSEHFENHSHLIQMPALHFVTHIAGILQNLYQLGEYEAMEPYEEKISAYSNSDTIGSEIAEYVWLHYRLQRGIMQFSSSIIDKTQPIAQKMLENPIPPFAWEYARLLILSTAIACLISEKKRMCLQYLQRLQDRELSINLAPVIYSTWIIEIILHFDNGDLDVMEARIRAFTRQLRKHGNYGLLEKLFFQLLTRQAHNHKVLLKSLMEKVEIDKAGSMTKSPVQQSLTFFRWDTWLMER